MLALFYKIDVENKTCVIILIEIYNCVYNIRRETSRIRPFIRSLEVTVKLR